MLVGPQYQPCVSHSLGSVQDLTGRTLPFVHHTRAVPQGRAYSGGSMMALPAGQQLSPSSRTTRGLNRVGKLPTSPVVSSFDSTQTESPYPVNPSDETEPATRFLINSKFVSDTSSDFFFLMREENGKLKMLILVMNLALKLYTSRQKLRP